MCWEPKGLVLLCCKPRLATELTESSEIYRVRKTQNLVPRQNHKGCQALKFGKGRTFTKVWPLHGVLQKNCRCLWRRNKNQNWVWQWRSELQLSVITGLSSKCSGIFYQIFGTSHKSQLEAQVILRVRPPWRSRLGWSAESPGWFGALHAVSPGLVHQCDFQLWGLELWKEAFFYLVT